MRITKYAVSLLLLISLIGSQTVLLAQTSPTNDWSAVKALSAGTKIKVKLKNGKNHEGDFMSASDSSLSLTVKGAATELTRDNIKTVHQTSKGSATKATLIGLGVGAGAGALIGGIGSSADDGFDKIDQAVTAGLIVIGGGIGALTGYLIGRGNRKKVLVYEAR
jgi:hypothetical protein